MFDSVARRYDVVNALLSFGLDRKWRRVVARSMAVRPGDIVLDLGCGTGELGRLFAGRCRVVGLDLSLEMLKVARRRIPTGSFVQASAFQLPFRAAGFSAAMSAFLLRNLNDLPAALGELARVLAPGGRVALLDITGPQSAPLRQLFDAYFSRAAPMLGALAGNAHAYRYLAGSLAQLPPSEEVLDLLGDAGFDRAASRPMTGGVVTLFTAVRR
jgi:demethylmenaquinone methyltransferase/2-methoxy-6-polyprenyl-1,4-benzoquinol methylase